MNQVLQQILVAAAVLGALLYLVLRMRKKKGCDGGCGCAKKDPLK
jgi:FeoB-associated Cys-rich membrane protein